MVGVRITTGDGETTPRVIGCTAEEMKDGIATRFFINGLRLTVFKWINGSWLLHSHQEVAGAARCGELEPSCSGSLEGR